METSAEAASQSPRNSPETSKHLCDTNWWGWQRGRSVLPAQGRLELAPDLAWVSCAWWRPLQGEPGKAHGAGESVLAMVETRLEVLVVIKGCHRDSALSRLSFSRSSQFLALRTQNFFVVVFCHSCD